ncbi:MAG TPA: T9SS type A sorting domain-containing protein [Ferruginibacter sp.]|nr:T9SS type A sorting domain-containing protein [Ferruginibacter sp.]
MKKSLPFLTCILLMWNIGRAQYVNIPDPDFRNFLQVEFPSCFNAQLQMDTTCFAVVNASRIDISNPGLGDCPYNNVTGIQYFKNLRYFNCANNSCLSLAGISLPATLDTLLCSYITAGPVVFPPGLVRLDCRYNSYTQLPALPVTLKNILCGENYLASLPTLPPQLEELDCSRNSITSLPALPSTLRNLECHTNSLTGLPALPGNLKNLSCYYNPLQSLPALSGTQLIQIIANNNQLTSLPALPSTLQYLFVGNNQLTTLPDLPASLTNAGLNGNFITSLPVLPASLSFLDCSYNSLTGLPALPGSLTNIKTEFNYLDCLPRIPESCGYLSFDYRIRCLPNKPVSTYFFRYDNNGYESAEPVFLCTPITNKNLCQAYPVITGNVFIDLNSNGIKDPGEFSKKNSKVSLQSGSYTFTDNLGKFEIATDSIGSASISAEAPQFFSASPVNASFNFTSYDTIVQQHFALQPTISIDSLAITVTPLTWAARPGFPFSYMISYENTGTNILSPVIVFEYDNNRLTFDSASNSSIIHNGNTVTLSAGSLIPGDQGNFNAYFTLNSTASLGDSLHATGTISANSTTAISTNSTVIRGSFDPNDKQATPQLSPLQVINGGYINYTIRFQNTGTDTAFTVVISDTLSEDLQMNSLQMIATSHNCKTTVTDNIIFFEFQNILLPDSNTNEPLSHGFVSFKIKPLTAVAVNTTIPNKAAIYFDYNAPVITNTAGTLIKDFITLPLRLISFYAVPHNDNTASLYWTTANEVNTRRFIIERSQDGLQFGSITHVVAKGRANNNYNAVVNDAITGIAFYRLKIVDNDGSYVYSPLVKIDRRKNAAGFTVMTNPVKDFIVIHTTDRTLHNTNATIINMQGAMVKTFTVKEGSQTIEIKDLPAGIYYLKTINGSNKIFISK